MAANRAIAALLSLSIGSVTTVAVTGCWGGPDLPPTAEVSGTVKLDGQPLPRGTVQFVPDESKGTSGATGVGEIDETGHYEITTAGVEGAIVGFHKVGVVAEQEYDPSMTSFAPSLIPLRYNDPLSSGLVFEVKSDEDNVIDINLTSQR